GLVALGLLAIGFGRRGAPALVPVFAAVAWQGAAILPFTPLFPLEVKPAERADAPRLRILLANVLQDNRDAAALLDEVARLDPDLVLAMETDAWWAEALTPLHATYPHRLSAPLPNTYGIILYARVPFEEGEVRYLIEPDIPSVHATFRLGGRPIRFHGVHPQPPVPGEGRGSSAPRDAELVVVGRAVRERGLPAIVAGDLNDVAWSATTRLFRKVSGTLDPRKGRGLYASFHAQIPLLRFPLDHVFHTPELRLRSLRVLPSVGSDHFPVFVELAWEPEAWRVQPHPEPDRDDLDEARAVMEEVRPDPPR
ncbi:MAG: endonuclease/exonuclease/phosphatase family protein, partial [Myxococcota bacterium]